LLIAIVCVDHEQVEIKLVLPMHHHPLLPGRQLLHHLQGEGVDPVRLHIELEVAREVAGVGCHHEVIMAGRKA
jgi:hypothetical protein